MVMAEYNSRPRTPIKVGFYDIIRTIGRGNFAVVKLARHRITKTEVAIKIIDKLRLDQINLKKIYREIQILKLLNHQHIIKLYQVMETSSTIYLVCEYARNGELFDYITENGHLPEEKARKMFWQVLTAVEYCHKNNVVHRDLKAENLLLDTNNNIKLADFGFSNFFQSGNMLSTWCGSPPYAAPEVFEGKVYEGPQLDVWSLGVVLYVLVCGTFPFDGSNLATLKERVLGGRFRIPYWMSQDCESLVRRMLVINPKKRLTISQIKKHKWMQAHNPNLTLTQTKSSPLIPRRGKLSEYNEHVLKIMQGLGINQQKTIESLNLSAYDHLYAIYHLLADRLKLHRTSFPLDTKSYDSDRRRPSNVADQAISYMSAQSTTLNVYSEYNKKGVSNPSPGSLKETVPDVHFDDISTGLPTVRRTLAAPARYASPPLPQIKTSMYEDEEPPTMPLCHNSSHSNETTHNPSQYTPDGLQLLSPAGYKTENTVNGDIKLGNYNLHQRRHTLMVPNPSQMQMLRAGMAAAIDPLSPEISPHSSTRKLSRSGEEMSSIQGLLPQEAQLPCEEHMCSSSSICECNRPRITFANNRGNVLLPCKKLPTAQKFTFDKRKTERPSVAPRRRSGLSPLVGNIGAPHQMGQGEGVNDAFETQASRVALIMKQRQLDTSPVGFREGRRASDGLLLLGDNLLKEHLQKLARAKAVPEITQEDSEESWETEGPAQSSHHLQVPSQVNRCSSGERATSPSSPGTSPVGSGGNISFQPYNNNQSLARRRSLQVHHVQNRMSAATTQPEPIEVYTSTATQLQPFVAATPGELMNNLAPEQGAIMHENDMSCHWSSWKKVPSSTVLEGTADMTPGSRQQLANVVSGMGWQDSDSAFNLGTLSVASDDSVPSRAAAAQQQQQRDSLAKPIRQQSLPITPTSTAHPFGVTAGQHQSLVQILQQRRLQRRLKVATNQQHQTPGYQLPLPELEQLRIDGNEFQQFNIPPHETAQPIYGVPPNPDQDWNLNWGEQVLHHGTTMHADERFYHNTEALASLPNPFPAAQDVLTFQNQQIAGDYGYRESPTQSMFSSDLPLIMTERFNESQLNWTYDSSVSYQKDFDFSKHTLCVAESRTHSAEKLEHAGSEIMEFALY